MSSQRETPQSESVLVAKNRLLVASEIRIVLLTEERRIEELPVAFDKDPQAVLDYGFDWDGLLDDDETLVSSFWSADSGVTVGPVTFYGTKATAWISGGTRDVEYAVTNSVVTSLGNTLEWSMLIRCKLR